MALLLVFGLSVVFSVTDFLTSSIAVGLGLSESNALLSAVGNIAGLNQVAAFGATKISVIAGSAIAAGVGINARDRVTRYFAFSVVAMLCGLFLFATLNNIFWIGTLR